jgi:hypothetical protein
MKGLLNYFPQAASDTVRFLFGCHDCLLTNRIHSGLTDERSDQRVSSRPFLVPRRLSTRL